MGNQGNFMVNSDGSVTISQELNPDISTILDIFRVEKAKGGPYACCRMKQKAVKYAKAKGLEQADLVVAKLMLANYPAYFEALSKARALKIWVVLAIVFVFIAMMQVVDGVWGEGSVLSCIPTLAVASFAIGRSLHMQQSIKLLVR